MEWTSIIASLRESGMTLANISAATQSPASTISDIARGASKEPRAELGIRLIDLHEKALRASKRKRKAA